MVAFVNQQSLSKRQLFDGDISSTTLNKTHAPGYDLFTLDDIQIVRKYIYEGDGDNHVAQIAKDLGLRQYHNWILPC